MVRRLSKEEVAQIKKEIANAKKISQKKRREKGRPGTYEDFLSEPVTQEEKDKYLAAIKMGDIESELGTVGYPKPTDIIKKATGGIVKTKKKKKKKKKLPVQSYAYGGLVPGSPACLAGKKKK